jgi:hypothetical protein
LYERGRGTLLAPLNATDFKSFALRLRFYKSLLQRYEAAWEGSCQDMVYPGSKVIYELERTLFPWLHYGHPTVQHLKASFNGPGIVIPTGSHHLRHAVFLIRSLRQLGCTLPICVAYAGEGKDLKLAEIAYLRGMHVYTMDVTRLVDAKMLELTGWQIKPFAALVAPFAQVILIDADVVVLKDPAGILETPVFREHGCVIFRDRTLFDKDVKKPAWLEAHIPAPLSEALLSTRMYKTVSAHEQESGVVVIDKGRCLMGLLAACKLNAKEERDRVTYKEFYGDKETFWIGMEMAGDGYGVLWERAGVIGQETNSTKIKGNKRGRPVVCGRILHFDEAGLPLWFNGGIVEDKRDEERGKYLVRFSHYAHEGRWEFVGSCVLDSPSVALNQTVLDTLARFGALWRPRINLLSGDPIV